MTRTERVDALCFWIARRLPRRLVYWCTVLAGAHATTGIYGGQIVPSLMFMEVLKRWDVTPKQ